MCKVCSGRHSTVLHGLKTQKHKRKGNNEDIDTNEGKPEEVKCASTNTGSDVIRMCIVPVQITSTNIRKRFTLVLFWIAAARVHSYWTNQQMALEYLEERPHLQSKY